MIKRCLPVIIMNPNTKFFSVILLTVCLTTIPGYQIAFGQTAFSDVTGQPVLGYGASGEWDDAVVWNPAVIKDGDTLRMWYTGHNDSLLIKSTVGNIGYAWSLDGINWNKYDGNPVLQGDLEWEGGHLNECAVIKDGDTLKMWYGADWTRSPSDYVVSSAKRIGYAESMDGKNWIKYPDPVLEVGSDSAWDSDFIVPHTVIKEENGYKMWFWAGRPGFPIQLESLPQTGMATSPDGIHWIKYDDPSTTEALYANSDPVLKVGSALNWDAHRAIDPIVLPTDTGYEMWYSGLLGPVTSNTLQKIGYATSDDGIVLTKWPDNPIIDDTLNWGLGLYGGSMLKYSDEYHFWYALLHTPDAEPRPQIGYAESSPYKAQFPEFTRIDTGAIHASTGHHISSGWFDMDNDRDMDVVITNTSGIGYTDHPNLFYRNESNGFFSRISNTEFANQSLTVGLPGPFGDIDNDGDQDLLVPDLMGTDCYIYRNDGDGEFTLSTNLTYLYGSTPVLFDLNNDTYLDLIQFNENDSRVYLNDGYGHFSDFESLDIQGKDPNAVFHNISMGDADNDGDFDLYIGCTNLLGGGSFKANNEFFLNSGSGGFERQPDSSLIVQDRAMTTSINWIDYDNDMDMDLYVLNTFDRESVGSVSGALFENKGGMVFEKKVIEPEEYRDANRISSVWGDLDNDADLDLYITIEKNSFLGHPSSIKHNLLLMNNNDGTFSEVNTGTLATESSHTATLEDVDNDGDLDVLLVRFSWADNGNNTLCINEENGNSWIMLTLEGSSSNMSAIGTRVTAKATIYGNSVTQTREITPMSGHFTYPSNRVHFGLGDADQADTIIIRWPSGNIDTYSDVHANDLYYYTEKDGTGTEIASTYLPSESFSIYPNPANNLLTIKTFLEDPYEIAISDLNGNKISVDKVGGSGHQLDLSPFPKGVYFITIRSKDFVITRKFIKME